MDGKADFSLAPWELIMHSPQLPPEHLEIYVLRAVRESRQRTESMASSFLRSHVVRDSSAHDPIFSVKSVSNRISIRSIEKNRLCVVQLHLQAQSVL